MVEDVQQSQILSTRNPSQGLVTVALLKATLDEGKDYLELFMPFVTDVIWSRVPNDFDIGEIREEMTTKHGLQLPVETMEILLRRAAKRGIIRRAGGRYFRDLNKLKAPRLATQRKTIEREINALADALRNFANDQGEFIDSDEEALSWLFSFLSEYQVQLLLDDENEQLELLTDHLNISQTRTVARFIQHVSEREPALAEYLRHVLEGFVLQNTLLLNDVNVASKTFRHLEVYFDSNFLFGLLGYNGPAREVANRELLELLRVTKAYPRAFDKTILEMRRILNVYESHLSTPEGRATLFPTELTRFILTQGYTASDIRQHSALLEQRIRTLGIEITQIPKRHREYTLDEQLLAERLRRASESGNEPRIVHDIDCVAAVLTIRRGQQPRLLDDARAVFATSNGKVVKTVVDWYRDNGMAGFPPIIHAQQLSNIAWLKRPASGSKLKLHELVALCAAALRPSRSTWNKFLRHLRRLEESGELSSDESIAIVVSELIEPALAEVEERDDDLDAASLTEIVERVKESYKEEAAKSIAAAVAEANRERRRREEVIAQVEDRSKQIARRVSTAIFGCLAWVILLGVILMLPNMWNLQGILPTVLVWTVIIVVTVISYASLVLGVHVKQLRTNCEAWLSRRICVWLLGSHDAGRGNA